MLTSEQVTEIQARVAADYECLDAPGFRDSLAARRDVAALFSDRAEMQAEIERWRERWSKAASDYESVLEGAECAS